MTNGTGQRRKMVGLTLTAAAAALVVGAAFAHGGYGAGYGAGCGAGAGGGPAAADQATSYGCSAGPGAGMRHGMGPGRGAGAGVGGVALLTNEERSAHHAKMQSLASYDECKAYMADFSKQVQERAKEKGLAFNGPNEAMCDRMKQHGRFTQ